MAFNSARTSTGFFCTLVQNQYGQIPLLVLTINDARTGIGIFHFGSGSVWAHSINGNGMPIQVLALLHFGSVPVWSWTITGTGIQWCLYRYWHFYTLVQYQYGHIPLLILTLHGASTVIDICGF
jgi:hypothetical protein